MNKYKTLLILSHYSDMLNKYTIHMKVYTVCSYVMLMQNTNYEFYTMSNKTLEREHLVVRIEHGQRNVFTTGQAKLDPEDYAFKYVDGR